LKPLDKVSDVNTTPIIRVCNLTQQLLSLMRCDAELTLVAYRTKFFKSDTAVTCGRTTASRDHSSGKSY
jgi:hypothetical protein